MIHVARPRDRTISTVDFRAKHSSRVEFAAIVPGTPPEFRQRKGRCRSDRISSVHDQVFRSGWGSVCYRKSIAYLRFQNFAEFFAELCALHAPIAPIATLYSVENITTPAFSSRLLIEGCRFESYLISGYSRKAGRFRDPP